MKPLPVRFIFGRLLTANGSKELSKHKQEKTFLDSLNELVITTTQNHWAYEDPLFADTLFHLEGDTLSLTLKYTTPRSWYRIRYNAPFEKITGIGWDGFVHLEFPQPLVHIYEQTNRRSQWVLMDETDLWPVGLVVPGNKKEMAIKKRIESSFQAMHYYC